MSSSLAPRSNSRDYIEAILWAVVITLLLRTFVIQAFRIPSESMCDTLLVGDFLFVNKLEYGPKVPFTHLRLPGLHRSEEHTSELQSHSFISYAVFCLKKNKHH